MSFHLIHSGDLLVWTVNNRQELRWTTLLPEHDSKGHNRIVFTLTPFNSHSKLITTSMDRSIVVWNIEASDISSSEFNAIDGAGADCNNSDKGK